MHRLNHPPDQVQLCTLLNIKTGGCSEDCSYCAQSSRHADKVGLKAEKLTDVETVLVCVLTLDSPRTSRNELIIDLLSCPR